MKYKARKSGNAIVVTIPAFIRESLNIRDKDDLSIKLEGKKIIVEKKIGEVNK